MHDLSPGIAPNGVFWTVRVPDDWVNVRPQQLDRGARFQIAALPLLDYGNLVNSLFRHETPPVPAVASFDIHWMGDLSPTTAVDPTANRFAFEGIMTHATIGWSASVPGSNFSFQSDPASTSHETFAELVRERNGIFFKA